MEELVGLPESDKKGENKGVVLKEEDYSGIEEVMEIWGHVNEEGRLPWEHLNNTKWAKRWREVDPDLGLRRMVWLQKIDEDKYQARKPEMMGLYKRKEDEDEWRYDMRLRLMFNRFEYAWKPGESGNPAGSSAGVRRAKKLSYTVRQALDAKLNEELAVAVGEEGEERKVMMTKKEIIAKHLVDIAATGEVTFPDPKGKRKKAGDLVQRNIKLKPDKWADMLLKIVKLINPQPIEQTEKVVQTVSFDIAKMMPKEAKMTVVRKITGREFEDEEEYLGDEEVVDAVLNRGSEVGDDIVVDGEVEEIYPTEEELEYENLAEEEGIDYYE